MVMSGCTSASSVARGVLLTIALALTEGCQPGSTHDPVGQAPSDARSGDPAVGSSSDLSRASADTVSADTPTAERPVVIGIAVLPSSAAPGERVTLAIRLRVAVGWHVGPVEAADTSGAATTIELRLPDGVVAEGDWRVPRPELIVNAMGNQRGHRGDVLMERDLRVAQKQPAGPVPLEYSVNYQACNDRVCLRPGPDTLRTTLAIVPK